MTIAMYHHTGAAAFSYPVGAGQFLHVIPLHLHGGMGVQIQGGADI